MFVVIEVDSGDVYTLAGFSTYRIAKEFVGMLPEGNYDVFKVQNYGSDKKLALKDYEDMVVE